MNPPVLRRLGFMIIFCWLGVAISLLSVPAVASADTTLQGLRVKQAGGNLRLEFRLDQRPAHRIFKLTNPDRVVIDFQHTRLASGVRLKAKRQQPLERIRYSASAKGILRVVLDLDRPSAVTDRVTSTRDGARLVLELPSHRRPTGSQRRASSRAASEPRNLIIAIDAGHGGKDPGAHGKAGTLEKDVVLSIATRLYRLLQKTPGYQPFLTRRDDTFLSLRERIRRARKMNADLFISIHADAALNHKAAGSSVYILSQNGASSEAARRLASRENAADLLGGVSLRDKEDTLAHILLDLTQRHTLDVSYAIAQSVRKELGRVGNLHAHRVEKAGFVVLKSPDIPSILVETAFISNRKEEQRLRSHKFQEKIARSILAGIKKYFREHAEPDTVVARLRKREHIIRSGETLSGIASRYKVRVSALRKYNKLNSDRIRPGQKLRIPVSDT